MCTGSPLERLWAGLRAIAYAAVIVAFWVWVARWLQAAVDPRVGAEIPAWLVPVGVLVAGLGIALALACAATFVVLGRGTPAPFDPPRELVPEGPYRYVRNPMALGAVAAAAGAGLALRSFGILLLALAMAALLHLFIVVYEEPTLERKFGDAYRAYREATPRWIPRLGRRS